jgi:hypothetical protein
LTTKFDHKTAFAGKRSVRSVFATYERSDSRRGCLMSNTIRDSARPAAGLE